MKGNTGGMVSQTTILGAAGEYYAMSQLLRRGFIAALAPAGVPNADIVVTDREGGRLCSIQVKARRDVGSDGGWHMSKKHEALVSERLLYCFIDFGKSHTAEVKAYVLPSRVVAETLSESHKRWLAIPGKMGPHKDTDMRRLLPDYSKSFGEIGARYGAGWLEQYRDAWHLLGLGQTDPTQPVGTVP